MMRNCVLSAAVLLVCCTLAAEDKNSKEAGEKFDPNVHQAMYEVPTSDQPPGQVAQVIQAGYMIGDRVLRPALVAVSKAAPKSPTSANDNPEPEDGAQ